MCRLQRFCSHYEDLSKLSAILFGLLKPTLIIYIACLEKSFQNFGILIREAEEETFLFINIILHQVLCFNLNKTPSRLQIKNKKPVCTCFCSKQCEHQKAPYILAPMEFRCFARETAKGLEAVVISVVKYGRSISAKLLI